MYKCYGLVRTIASQYRLSVQLCSDLVSASSVSLSSSLVLSKVLKLLKTSSRKMTYESLYDDKIIKLEQALENKIC